MSVLITGGAGYIGSVTVELLRERGEEIIVLDNLCRGHREAVDPSLTFVEGDIGDFDLVQRVVQEHDIEACIHFAAFAYVGESVNQPEKYFENNSEKAIRLLRALLAEGVGHVVFSSTCSTYGEPTEIPIPETIPSGQPIRMPGPSSSSSRLSRASPQHTT